MLPLEITFLPGVSWGALQAVFVTKSTTEEDENCALKSLLRWNYISLYAIQLNYENFLTNLCSEDGIVLRYRCNECKTVHRRHPHK